MKRKFYLKPARKSSITLLLGLLLLTCCTRKHTPPNVLVKIYVDNLIAEETYSFNADSLRIHREKIFKENNITPELYRNELDNYKNDPDAWDQFFKKSAEMLDSLKRIGKIN